MPIRSGRFRMIHFYFRSCWPPLLHTFKSVQQPWRIQSRSSFPSEKCDYKPNVPKERLAAPWLNPTEGSLDVTRQSCCCTLLKVCNSFRRGPGGRLQDQISGKGKIVRRMKLKTDPN